MLTLVTGRAGSGKSEYLYKLASSRAKEGAKNAVFLVPETCSHEAERQLCIFGGDSISLSCEVLTFRRLANRVFSVYGGLAEQTLGESGRILVMYRALEAAASQLTYYRPDAKGELLSALCTLIDELKSSSVTPEALLSAAMQSPAALGSKLRDLSVIYACYEAILKETGADSRDILSMCAEKLAGSGFFDGRDVYIDGFSGFTPQELDILKNLTHANVTAAFTVDSLTEPDMLFEKPAHAAARLMTLIADGHAKQISLDPPQRAPGLAHLEKYLFRFSDITGKCENGEVRFHYAEDIFTECEYAAAMARELVRSGVRLRDIAVAAGDLGNYRIALTSAFDKYALPYYISENARLDTRSAAMLIIKALDIASGGFTHDAVFSYLKTGLAVIDEDECSELENYCLRWRIKPRQWTQKDLWTMHPDGFAMQFDEESNMKLCRINELRDLVRAPLIALKDALAEKSKVRDKLTALYEFTNSIGLADAIDRRAAELTESAPEEAAQYGKIFDVFIDCIDQFDEICGAQDMDAEKFCAIMQRMISSCEIGAIPPTIDRISIGTAASAAMYDAPYLFILGAYDGAFPADPGSGGLLSDRDRDILDGCGIELSYTAEQRDSEALFTLYTAIASPRKALFLSVPERDSSGSPLTPAFLMRRAYAILPDAPVTTSDDEVLLSCPEAAFDYAYSGMPKSAAMRETLRSWDGFSPAFSKFEDIAGGYYERREAWRLDDSENTMLFGRAPRLSASRLEKYNGCPFSYFASYGLSLTPRREAAFDAPHRGTFIHYVLEGTVRDIREAGGFQSCTIEDVKDFAERRAEEYIKSSIPDFDTKTARFKYLFRRLCSNLNFLVENLYNEFRSGSFMPLDFELQFSTDLPPVNIDLDSGRRASFSGIADRIDGWVKDGILYLRVIDYKSRGKDFSYGEISAGLGLQLPVYLFALQANSRLYLNRHPELDADTIVPAGILYTPANVEAYSAGHDLDDDDIAGKIDEKLRRSGIVLDDPEVLEAMEPGIIKNGRGRYIPVKITRSGTSDTAISAERFGLLGKHVRGMLKATAELMEAGNYKAMPTQIGSDDPPCKYCEFKSVCGLDIQAHPEKIRQVEKKKPDEFFDEAERSV